MEIPPWAVSAGQCALLSLVTTTVVMASSAANSATPTVGAAQVRRRKPEPVAVQAASLNERSPAAGGGTADVRPVQTAAPPAEGGPTRRHRIVLLHPTVPPTPCVGSCPDGYTITATVPFVENGSVSQEQNVVPCSAVPPGQPVVTCSEDEGRKYPGSPSPTPGTG
jgi:hypothetical protein